MSCSALSFRLGTFGAWWVQLQIGVQRVAQCTIEGPPGSLRSHRPSASDQGKFAIQAGVLLLHVAKL
eukprot:1932847-Amphidinium_carterae.2